MGRFSYSPKPRHLSSSFGAWWGDSLTRPRLDISVVVRCVVGRFSYSPQAGYLLSSFGAWWGDSLTRPRLDTSRHRSEHGGEILLLAPGWTFLIFVQCVLGRFSYSPQAGHLSSSFRPWWGDSLTHPMLDISYHRSACGGETLLLAPGWTCLVVLQHMVGRFSYSPQAGHLWSLFGT